MYVDGASNDFSVEREKWGILNLQFKFSYELRELENMLLIIRIYL